MLKGYDELRKIDVTPYCEKRDKALYLNWAKCVDLLHQHGAEEAYFLPIPNPATGNSLYESQQVFTDGKGNTNRCYETRISVHIDGKEYTMQSPVMNGSSPVKDNSMSQQRVWNSMCRSFVKCVAIHTGLGFDLWLKEETADEKTNKEVHHEILGVKERVFDTITLLNKKGLSLADIAGKMQKSEEELKMYLGYYKILFGFENNLNYILKNDIQ